MTIFDGSLIKSHIEHLLAYEEIESSCAVSSQLLGTFFHKKDWKIIYGAYGPHSFFHSWIETPQGILDPTRFQFLTNKTEINYYKKSECTPFYNYILHVQDQWFFDLEDPAYHRIAVMDTMFQHSQECNYGDFLEKARHTEAYKKFNWRDSYLKGHQVTFRNYLQQKGKRIGKKHFVRYAICSN